MGGFLTGSTCPKCGSEVYCTYDGAEDKAFDINFECVNCGLVDRPVGMITFGDFVDGLIESSKGEVKEDDTSG